ncbi:MAG: magnesium chelatase [Candidatus Magasanikbacteria bacterium RIFOXYC2_FULL_42_28]|uniref:Magnesium chelatase n=1 Tax=Candidatus Magasanikbacteria bacterium RIFOXYC2_FULL_42_28 TaxID=1798704 RepID=A0A1F6NV04_9BACT|nr:MAG: magnesium chelatase [Candidatus Magasanikbacteria bacterium RIFOXYC2_FULL_42_28]
MFFKLQTAATVGLDARPVDVEVDISKGQTMFNIVGLADTSIKEARDRVHSALKNSGFNYPFNFRILINLAPADLPKEGTGYDLPIAVGLIAVSQNIALNTADSLLVGQLALDGAVRHTPGILPMAVYAKSAGCRALYVPAMDAPEAALVRGLTIYPVKNLTQIMDHLTGKDLIAPYVAEAPAPFIADAGGLDMSMIKGQEFAKRALEVAAAGGHNILLSGPPGSGKTLLARTLPSILPPLLTDEALEITKIYSIAGLLPSGLIMERPFRGPHHTISHVALVGGGRCPRPGEISLSHRGVLFLDEFPEFPRTVLEALRQPLEDGQITIARAHGSLTFPARFILVASQNPCPCGYNSDPDKACTCSSAQISNYTRKISGPILDRIDLQVEVPRVPFEKLSDSSLAESSAVIAERVRVARDRQTERLANTKILTNSEMGNAEIRAHCQLDKESVALLRSAVDRLHLSARAYGRILKLARTIADLNARENIEVVDIAEALQYRGKE